MKIPKIEITSKKIFLAAPYSSNDSTTRNIRVKITATIAAELMLQNNIVFAPTVHGHTIALTNEDIGLCAQTWGQLNNWMLRHWADTLVVATLDGWDTSKGIANEIKIAIEFDKEIYYV